MNTNLSLTCSYSHSVSMIDLDKNKLAEIPPTILATNATVEIANPIFAVI